MSGTLYLVATPIGNLEDITLRALRILREVDCVLAEDTRRTRGLLVHHAIETRLASLHAHTSDARVLALADELALGQRFALVTDAGTPLVSDPGGALVQAAIARGVRVEAIPGASAVMAALCVAGVPAEHFRFVGFLPRSGRRRREALQAIASDRLTSVLFEAPPRLCETLAELSAACGPDRPAAVCRELTKLHEEIARGPLGALSSRFQEAPRGELTLVIEGARGAVQEAAEAPKAAEIDGDALIDEQLARGLGAREIARVLAEQTGIDRREAYKRVIIRREAQKGDGEGGD